MPSPDWSEVTWYVYESPAGVRVLPRKLSGDGSPHYLNADGTPALQIRTRKQQRAWGEHRPGEKLAATVSGVSRKTVLSLLKANHHPGDLAARISLAAEAQFARGADDRRPNLYLSLVAERKREAEAKSDKRAA